MVGSPIAKRVIRNRRTVSHFALRLFRSLNPVRAVDLRAEQRRRRRERRRWASAQLLRDLKDYFQVPRRRNHRHIAPPAAQPDLPVLLSSDEEEPRDQQPEEQQPPVEVADLAESFEELPDLQPAVDGRNHHLSQAYVLLERLPNQEVDFDFLERQLAAFDAPQPPEQPEQQLVDWVMIAHNPRHDSEYGAAA